MKRYIRSVRTMSDLAMEYNGRTEYLPTWFLNKSDEEIAKAKAVHLETLKKLDEEETEIDDFEPDPRYTGDNLDKLINDLLDSGYTDDEVVEILNRVQDGWTLDSAMQEIDMRNEEEATL